jgi:large subunit ribosomal protein L24
MAARIRKGDTVEVLTGRNKGARGMVLSIISERNRVLVENVNMVKRHQKPTSAVRQGGIIEKPSPIDMSNVALVHKGDAVRVGFRVVDGKKLRWSRKHDEAIDG